MDASVKSANANAANAAYQFRVQAKQADEQRRSIEIQALQQENARTEEFARARSSALAAIGASGIGEHISFFQGIDPDQQDAWLRDVRNVRLNLTQQRVSLADQVQVAEFGARMGKFNAHVQKVGAVVDFVNTAMSAASFYGNNKTPAPKGG